MHLLDQRFIVQATLIKLHGSSNQTIDSLYIEMDRY